jgi:alanine dehydrogenase
LALARLQRRRGVGTPRQAPQACLADPHLLAGLNVHRGRITHPAVARDLGLPYTPPEQALEAA